MINYNNRLEEGRNYLYEEYLSAGRDTISEAVASYRHLTNIFDEHLVASSNGAEEFYDMGMHRFVEGYNRDRNNPDTQSMWRRDHIIHKIEQFVQVFFKNNKRKAEAVEAYLRSKVYEGNKSPYQFIQDSNISYSEDKLDVLFDKLENGTFKSIEEKRNKKEYLSSNEHKIQQLNGEIDELYGKLSEIEIQIYERGTSCINRLIEQISNRLKREISDNGKKGLNNMLVALENLKDGIENGYSLIHINFQPYLTFQGYKNCFEDSSSLQFLYEGLKNAGEYIESIEKLKLELEQLVNPIALDEINDEGVFVNYSSEVLSSEGSGTNLNINPTFDDIQYPVISENLSTNPFNNQTSGSFEHPIIISNDLGCSSFDEYFDDFEPISIRIDSSTNPFIYESSDNSEPSAIIDDLGTNPFIDETSETPVTTGNQNTNPLNQPNAGEAPKKRAWYQKIFKAFADGLHAIVQWFKKLFS